MRQDLVYFVHDKYAGVSAFVQEEADKQHRNASFVAVGALVPLSYGRLGKSWVHAEALRGLARETVQDLENRTPLERLWEKHGTNEAGNGAASSTSKRSSLPSGFKRKRALSDATGSFATEGLMSLDHPALSMTTLITTFGPLLFPLYREALLRKRILLLGSTPVQPTCNYGKCCPFNSFAPINCANTCPVYDLSVLSNVPQSLQESLSSENGSARLKPLFNVGVFDITRLESHKEGWLACTTDDILGEKKKLYDILVELPTSNPSNGRRAWPKLRTADGETIKATQRDFRRYVSLRRQLRKLERGSTVGMQYRGNETEDMDGDQDESAPLVASSSRLPDTDCDVPQSDEAELLQPETWSAVAYRSFMWWASAGEKDTWEAEETLTDQALLEDLPDLSEITGRCHGRAPEEEDDDAEPDSTLEAQRVATILVAYFHRVTGAILQTLTNLVERADDDTEEGYEEDAIEVSEDDMRRMGIDAWSAGDRRFVEDMMRLYFDRDAVIEDDGVRMCGMRIC